MIVRDLTEHCQEISGVAVDRIRTTVGKNRPSSPLHVLRAGLVARQLQGEVRLDAAADIGASSGIHGPAALGKLLLHKILGQPLGEVRILAPQEGQEQDRFTLENRIAFQFGDPVSVLPLLAEQPIAGSSDRTAGTTRQFILRVTICREGVANGDSGPLLVRSQSMRGGCHEA